MNNVVTVSSKSGEITDPVAAVNSITDATAENQYFVVIGPGEFILTETLIMKPFVNIVGSGMIMTRLTGSISSDTPDSYSAIVSTTGNSILQDLAIENTGGSYYSIALHNGDSTPLIKNVYAKASGGLWGSVGVLNDIFSAAIMNGVIAIGCGNGSENCYGVVNTWFSTPTMINVVATAIGGKYKNKDIIDA